MKLNNIEIIKFDDEEYPIKLKDLKVPPKQLYVIGNKKLLKEFSIAIVGTRKCATESANMATQYGYELASRDIVIVSGMASGIDTSAHKGALNANGKTIAVLGAGFNNIFPKENIELFYEIIENDGLIITEYEEDMPPLKYNFVHRNRIIAALTEGVVVIEAGLKSGALKTAEDAIDLKRKLFAVPGSVHDKGFLGSNQLLLKGAMATLSSTDILSSFENKEFKKVNKKQAKKVIVPEEFMEIYNLLSKAQLNVDQISKELKMPISRLNSKLTAMEIEGYIKEIPGGFFDII